ncbi:aspartate 1-decarboxylase [Ewingella americana]|uniref:Aspartate 1-decarboxylase n=1 Tax=Ewingella americana TaxID=41202 RepID=A0A502GCH1_9GAMM|nr:aspartate 1-decarboxylase [Ewingella americana]TPG59967.1 aspartate 1-decarboxylase [Ewingella americana]
MSQEATRQFCYGKIHRALVTDAQVDYVGSITIDPVLLQASGILPYTQVDVVNVNSGGRLQTYVIEGEMHSGQICLNGAAAHLFNPGDLCIIMGYEDVPVSQLPGRIHKAVLVDAKQGNRIVGIRELVTPHPNQVGNANRYGEEFNTVLQEAGVAK